MVASLRGNMGTGTKKDESSTGRIWAAEFHLFSLGPHFETYELFISLIFQIFWGGRGQLRITETAHTESADTAVNLYLILLK